MGAPAGVIAASCQQCEEDRRHCSAGGGDLGQEEEHTRRTGSCIRVQEGQAVGATEGSTGRGVGTGILGM